MGVQCFRFYCNHIGTKSRNYRVVGMRIKKGKNMNLDVQKQKGSSLVSTQIFHKLFIHKYITLGRQPNRDWQESKKRNQKQQVHKVSLLNEILSFECTH